MVGQGHQRAQQRWYPVGTHETASWVHRQPEKLHGGSEGKGFEPDLYGGWSEPQTVSATLWLSSPTRQELQFILLFKVQLKKKKHIPSSGPQLAVRNSEPELKTKLCLPNIVFEWLLFTATDHICSRENIGSTRNHLLKTNQFYLGGRGEKEVPKS